MEENETTEDHTAKNVTVILALAFGVGAVAAIGHTIGKTCGEAAIAKAMEIRDARRAKKDTKKNKN